MEIGRSTHGVQGVRHDPAAAREPAKALLVKPVGDKRSVAAEANEIPIGVAITGTNRNGIPSLEPTLDIIVANGLLDDIELLVPSASPASCSTPVASRTTSNVGTQSPYVSAELLSLTLSALFPNSASAAMRPALSSPSAVLEKTTHFDSEAKSLQGFDCSNAVRTRRISFERLDPTPETYDLRAPHRVLPEPSPIETGTSLVITHTCRIVTKQYCLTLPGRSMCRDNRCPFWRTRPRRSA